MEGNLIDLSTDDILEPLADIALADIATLGISPKPVTPGPKSSLNIRQAGQLVPQSSIFDIKTRYRHNTLPMSDTYPVLWLRQIPNFVLAYNDGGNFYDIRKHSLANVLSAWEQDHAQELKRFVVLIRRIVKLAREQDCAKLEIYRPTSSGDFDGIQIWKQAGDGVDVLPQHLRDRWTRRESGSVALPEEALISLETDDGKNGQSSGSKANTSKFEDGFAADDEDAGLKADFTA